MHLILKSTHQGCCNARETRFVGEIKQLVHVLNLLWSLKYGSLDLCNLSLSWRPVWGHVSRSLYLSGWVMGLSAVMACQTLTLPAVLFFSCPSSLLSSKHQQDYHWPLSKTHAVLLCVYCMHALQRENEWVSKKQGFLLLCVHYYNYWHR